MSKPFIITIDGPAGVGKSSLAKKLAKAFDIAMLDTGAMYRTLGLKLGASCMDMTDEKLERLARSYVFTLDNNSSSAQLLCNNERVDDLPIRTEKASRLSSLVAKLPIIRTVLHESQRAISQNFSLLTEGRDMGTKVFPNAQCKIFLDAQSIVRAKRRYDELIAKGEEVDYDSLLENLIERDNQDRNRVIDPLKPAEDAYIFDTSEHTFEEVYNHLYEYIGLKMKEQNQNIEEEFTHLDKNGNACMVDVGDKSVTKRIAIVGCRVDINENTMRLLKENALPKGDVLTTAKIAGILAAKQTSALIPMCHPLAISYADIRFNVIDTPPSIEIEAEVHTADRTGVEMEALIAAQITSATIYDMCKAVQKDICISECRLLHKSGGKSLFNYQK